MTHPFEDKNESTQEISTGLNIPRFRPNKTSKLQFMYFYKQTFSDANEHFLYTFFKSIKIFNIYHPNIKYTYNYDATNYFG